ncbi:glycosyltransferase [bacterium (Candidatus Blackallbacteria) CG17_big_fil_post_rev_8_21_14_2_50_48_46]|uniref:Glycosyltransferase n=1 Tax=bacterium (Candidatus Blackallbacteria) CG17_big_fil_post_rev_8_21_14_2_50_48_46 TaxID=2014261 RepID=A0A2M7GA64_9BACT|nr:MAG: glycosyltransferase [bacterium (Candidatus Blackallbacteria) CG18_big_fil_WC_8_21_14_2_50_49_26]PIW18984.1 MAG: glycosyltransferase [bacterium (Candidatus Blackallbacteria) CG17_big_fil_post_rev_8_21_14_2_50_48_46]PIW44648.1 MAG: glycosyltransferase [bacterium (Candidatus Blackallbacteria) CG13_big_fil_rev_8_21_14_2_50_49_14]
MESGKESGLDFALLDHRFRRILLINFGGIGDEILFFPVIEDLRRHYPDARISVVVEPRCKSIMEQNYFIDEVFCFDIKHRRHPGDLLELLGILRNEAPDLLISSGGSPLVACLLFLSGAPVRVGYATPRFQFLLTHPVALNKEQYAARMYHDLLNPLGFPNKNPVPGIYLPHSVRHWVDEWLKNKGVTEPYILIHPGVSLLSKQKQLIKSWALEKWEALIRQLLQEGRTVILAGGPDDAEELAYLTSHLEDPRLLSIYGQTRDMYQLGGFIQRAGVMICVDSAPMHLGVGLNVPLVAIFGPTDETKLLPPEAENIRVIHAGTSCRPCLWAVRQTTCEALTCLQDIQVAQVYQAVSELLAREAERAAEKALEKSKN